MALSPEPRSRSSPRLAIRLLRSLAAVAAIPGAVLTLSASQTLMPPAAPVPPAAPSLPVALREPFTLRLLFKGEEYRKRFESTPYVSDRAIHIFPGEHVGVHVTIKDGELVDLSYASPDTPADVDFDFSSGEELMRLVVQNRTGRTLYMNAVMRVPERDQTVETKVIPVEPSLPVFSYWNRPILQLTLRGLRFRAPGGG